MNKITKVELKIENDYLTKYVKEIKLNKDIEMLKKTKQDLPTGINEMYSIIFSLLTGIIKKEKFDNSNIFNLLFAGVRHYSSIKTEIEQDGLKEHLIGKLTADVLQLLRPYESKVKYGTESILAVLQVFFKIIKEIQTSKTINYLNYIDDFYLVVIKAKSVMNEFNDLDNEEIGTIAEYVAGEIL